MSSSFSPRNFQVLPLVVKNIMIICALLFLATIALAGKGINLVSILGMRLPLAADFKIWQPITHLFMHDPSSIWHILFNMFSFWMFGSVLENLWGSKRFLNFFILSGLGAAAIHYAFIYWQILPNLKAIDAFIQNPNADTLDPFILAINNNIGQGFSRNLIQNFNSIIPSLSQNDASPELINTATLFATEAKLSYLNQFNIIGASGAVSGIWMAFAYLFPNSVLYLYLAIPVKAKYLAAAYFVYELYQAIFNSQSNIAHIAHLGGMVIGLLIVRYLFNQNNRNQFY